MSQQVGPPPPPQAPPPRDRRLAIVCVLGILICIFMSFVELSRAMAGDNTRAWFYAFEWPLFAVFIAWIWRRLERRHEAEYREGQQHQVVEGE